MKYGIDTESIDESYLCLTTSYREHTVGLGKGSSPRSTFSCTKAIVSPAKIKFETIQTRRIDICNNELID